MANKQTKIRKRKSIIKYADWLNALCCYKDKILVIILVILNYKRLIISCFPVVIVHTIKHPPFDQNMVSKEEISVCEPDMLRQKSSSNTFQGAS